MSLKMVYHYDEMNLMSDSLKGLLRVGDIHLLSMGGGEQKL